MVVRAEMRLPAWKREELLQYYSFLFDSKPLVAAGTAILLRRGGRTNVVLRDQR